MTRTFDRSHWEAALASWDAGKFSDEWKPYRHQAAMRGMIYPPEGTRWDSWEDDDPSHRAIIVRAIRETPDLLSRSIEQSNSWAEVSARVVRTRDEWREQIAQRDRLAELERADYPRPREATQSIAAILGRIQESLP